MKTKEAICAAVLSVVSTLVGGNSVPTVHALTIDWVAVGDPGNTADSTGYGAVAESFRIMKYELTNSQYVAFLNSVAATDTYSLYDGYMNGSPNGGITRTGASGAYAYSVRPYMGDKPVTYVSWFDAARVANWLHNGATSSSSTETGAYTLGGATSGNAPARNPEAKFYIPTENQWYKAAYYKGGNTNAGYWDFATQSDTVPSTVTAGSTGIASAGSTGNSANYSIGAGWATPNGTARVTTVATNGGANSYGAFDMGGNVREFFDLTVASSSIVGIRGGSWSDNGFQLSSSSRDVSYGPSNYDGREGIRLAGTVGGPSGVPEIDAAAVHMVLGVIVFGLAILEKQRRGR